MALQIIVNHYYQETCMNKHQVKGRIEKAKGKVKEVAGKMIGNKDLERKGKMQNIKGKVQAGYGDTKENFKEIL